MQRKKNQHYVWREYLRSWATNEKIACLREGKFIEPNPNLKNIGQERYFYRTEPPQQFIDLVMKINDLNEKLILTKDPRENEKIFNEMIRFSKKMQYMNKR